MSETPSDLICNETLDDSMDKGTGNASSSAVRRPTTGSLSTASLLSSAAASATGTAAAVSQQYRNLGYGTGATPSAVAAAAVNNKYTVRGAGANTSPSLSTVPAPAPSVSRPTYSVASQPSLGRVIQSPLPQHSANSPNSNPNPLLSGANSAAAALSHAAAQTNLQRIGFQTPAPQHSNMNKYLFTSFTDPLTEIGGGTLKASTPISSTITNLNYPFGATAAKPAAQQTQQQSAAAASNIIRSNAVASANALSHAQPKPSAASSVSAATGSHSAATLAQLTAHAQAAHQQSLAAQIQLAAQQQAVGYALKFQQEVAHHNNLIQAMQATRNAAALAQLTQQAQTQQSLQNRNTLDFLRSQQSLPQQPQSQSQSLFSGFPSVAAQSHALPTASQQQQQQAYNALASPQPKLQRNAITPAPQLTSRITTIPASINSQRSAQTPQSQISKPSIMNSFISSSATSTITPQLTAFGSTSSRLLPQQQTAAAQQIVTPNSQGQTQTSPFYQSLLQQSPQTPQQQLLTHSMTTPSPRPTILRKRGDGASTPAKRKLAFGDQPSTSSNALPNSGVLSINQSVIQHGQGVNRQEEVKEIKPSGTPEESPKKRNRKQVFEHEESTENVKVAIQVPTNLLTQIDQKKRGRPRIESKYSTHPTIQIPETTKIFVDLESPEEKVKKPDLTGFHSHKPGIPPHALAHSSHASGEYSIRGTRGGRGGMRGARMGLMNSAMHRSSPGKSQTPTSGPLLPSNMSSMQQSFGRGGGRGGGGARQNLYGIKHSAEENSPPPEYANNIPTLQKHARGPNITPRRGGRGGGPTGSSEVAAANILRAKAIYNADQRSDDGKRVLTAAEKKMAGTQRKVYKQNEESRSRESSTDASATYRREKMVNGFTKDDKQKPAYGKKLMKKEAAKKPSGRGAHLKRGRKPGPGRGKKGPMKKSENIAMLTHLKPHLYLTLKQIKMLEAKQGILEKTERLRIDAEIKEEDEVGMEKMKNAMQKAIEMKKWNLEKKEQKVTLFLANSLRKTQKEQELDRKILEAKAKLGKVQSLALDQSNSYLPSQNRKRTSILDGYPTKFKQQKFIFRSPELLHYLVKTNREYENLLYKKKKMCERQSSIIDNHAKKIVEDLERRLAAKAECLNSINTELTAGWSKLTEEGKRQFQKMVRQMLQERMMERKMPRKRFNKQIQTEKPLDYKPNLKLTVVSETKSTDSELPSTSKGVQLVSLEATETAIEELMDEMLTYVTAKLESNKSVDMNSLVSRSTARTIRILPLNAEHNSASARSLQILMAYKSLHRLTSTPTYSRIISNLSKCNQNGTPEKKGKDTPSRVIDDEGRVRDLKQEKWWEAVSFLSKIKSEKSPTHRPPSRAIKTEDDVIEVDVTRDSGDRTTIIEGPSLEDSVDIKPMQVKIAKNGNDLSSYTMNLLPSSSNDHIHTVIIRTEDGATIRRKIRVPLTKTVKLHRTDTGRMSATMTIHRQANSKHAEGSTEEKILKKLRGAEGTEIWTVESTPESRMTKVQNITRRVLKRDGTQKFVTAKKIILAEENEDERIEEMTEIKKEEVDGEEKVQVRGDILRISKKTDREDGRTIQVRQMQNGTRITCKTLAVRRIGRISTKEDGKKIVAWRNVLKEANGQNNMKLLKRTEDGTEYWKKTRRNGTIVILKKTKEGRTVKMKRKSKLERDARELMMTGDEEEEERKEMPGRPILVRRLEKGKMTRQKMTLIRNRNGDAGLIGLNRLKSLVLLRIRKRAAERRRQSLRSQLKKACRVVAMNGTGQLALKRKGVITRRIAARKVNSAAEYVRQRDEERKLRRTRKREWNKRMHGVPTTYRILCRRVERFNEDVLMYERLEREICDTFMEFAQRYDPCLYWQIVCATGKDRCKEDTDEDIELKRYQRIRQAILAPPIEVVPQDRKFAFGEASANVIINPTVSQVNCTMKGLSPFWKGSPISVNDDATYIDRKGILNFDMDENYSPLIPDYREIYLKEFEKGLSKEKLDSTIRSFDRYLDVVYRNIKRQNLFPVNGQLNVSPINNGESRRAKTRSDSSDVIPLAEGPSSIPKMPALLRLKMSEARSEKLKKMSGEIVELNGLDRVEQTMKEMKLSAVPVREKFAAALKCHHLSLLLAMQRRDALLTALLATAPEQRFSTADETDLAEEGNAVGSSRFKIPQLPKYKRMASWRQHIKAVARGHRRSPEMESPSSTKSEPKPPSRRAAVMATVTNAVNAVAIPEEEDEIYYNEQLQQAIKESLKDLSPDAPSTSRD